MNRLRNRLWRLNNLYKIMTKEDGIMQFRPNWGQMQFLQGWHNRNVILKARQLGFTTLMCLIALDMCLFNSNVRAGIIAHHKDDAKAFFRDKVKFAYRNMPDAFRAARPIETENVNELMFSNNSSIRVSTGFRSGTINFLHLSEYGKICARKPEVAREIRTGAFPAVPKTGVITIESTAEGQTGDFHDKSKAARDLQLSGREPGPLDYKFFFFPWFKNPEYELDPNKAMLHRHHEEYFQGLEANLGILLSAEQRAWYAAVQNDQQDDMKREYPSTPEEAFEAAIEGAYYASQFAGIRENKQICNVPYDPALPVHTAWDLGMADSTSIWFVQALGDREYRVIDHYTNSGEGLEHYAKHLDSKPYKYGRHIAPHDIRVKELGSGKSRLETARGLGIVFDVAPQLSVQDGINAARNILPKCYFDERKCSEGVKSLEAYRKEWDDKNGCWKNNPLHDWTSHDADAFRYFAVGFKTPSTTKLKSTY
ncbi:hypothetical protein [Pseudodesulfovibrio sediminis]|uniref:Phage terminase large subunit n=1 Tax=Pseudodesulfovibrio sediminis TaxID=2810563 RepID=A0ABM7P3B2_9BACT|nr:hypothetical protein [Pseudodesulfovibrio sediminis]BCS87341.1 phage terminase large subunit [Pseudodesulfovibrio sediminis]